MIKVKATFPDSRQFGFYGNERRYDGDEFTIASEKEFSEKWMVKVSTIGRPKKVEKSE